MSKAKMMGMPRRGIPNAMCRDKHMKTYTQIVPRRKARPVSGNKKG